MKFTVDTQFDHIKYGFHHDMESESIQACLDSCVKDLTAAHALYDHRPHKSTLTIWQDSKPVGKWVVYLSVPVPVPFDSLCPTCGGEGGMDSGGVTPWGAGINIPCPSCADSKVAIIGNLNKTNGHRPECVCSLCKDDCPNCRPSELAERKAMDETIARLLERTKCGCLSLDCTKHGSYLPDDWDIFKRITETRKLLPPKQLVERTA